MEQSKRILIVAAEADWQAATELIKHLALVVRQGLAIVWHESNLEPGCEWDLEMPRRIQEADIFLVLCSHTAMNDQGFENLCRRALARKYPNRDAPANPDVTIVPVFLDWGSAPMGLMSIMGTPRGSAVNDFGSRDHGWTQVVRDIRRLLEPSEHPQHQTPWSR